MNVLCLTDAARLWVKVAVTPSCWLWTAGLTSAGYAKFWLEGKTTLGHIVVYETLVGYIPDGLTLDHLCRVRRCVNPEHLEPVTQQVNTLRSPIAPAAINARKTHCPWGHPFDVANTLWSACRGGAQRQCRACTRNRARQRRAA